MPQSNKLIKGDISEESKKECLGHEGENILVALEQVADSAKHQLDRNSLERSQDIFAYNPNNIVNGRRAEQRINEIQSDIWNKIKKLTSEPFIACVEVLWDDSKNGTPETLFITRGSAECIENVKQNRKLASYRAPLGRLAELKAGEYISIPIAGKEKEGTILKRIILKPNQKNGVWDALDSSFEFSEWNTNLDSVRHFLKELGDTPVRLHPEQDLIGQLLNAAAEADAIRDVTRRNFRDQMALRDQPILDRYQGEIFRMPLDRQVLLFGPPGSGKTTTLIKRLAQKRTREALTDDELALLPGRLKEELFSSNSWAMFSPTELLKLYLKDAFNREDVPAADSRNLRTWDKERSNLARNVLGIWRSANSGKFQYDDEKQILISIASSDLCLLYDEFSQKIEEALLNQCDEALAYLLNSKDDIIRKESAKLQSSLGATQKFSLGNILALLDDSERLQVENKRLNDLIEEEKKSITKKIYSTNPTILDEIIAELSNLLSENEEDETDDAEDTLEVTSGVITQMQAAKLLTGAVKSWARAVIENRKPGGRSGRIIEILGSRMPPKEQFMDLGENIVTLARLRILLNAPKTFVLGIPSQYAKFRRQVAKENRYFSEESVSFIEKNRISGEETDILILLMLHNARRLLQYPDGRRLYNSQQDWLESIKSRYLMQVYVDEATDLSAIQLACTIELSHPKIRSWFACGDLRQRITAGGIQGRNEAEWLNNTCDVRINIQDINIGYRQSKSLRDLEDKLSEIDTGLRTITIAPKATEGTDKMPVLAEMISGKSLARWLAERIQQVEASIGSLPSIAVFVDGDNQIDKLVAETQPFLKEHHISIVGCKEGRVVGDSQEVRVFDVKHVKGLEFEAVFFVGIDQLAVRTPDLFQRYLYVGVTRAATYLGLTCEGSLPESLEPIRSNFTTDAWT